MKIRSLPMLLATCLAGAAMAQPPAPPPPATAVEADGRTDRDARADQDCVRQTGSRIQHDTRAQDPCLDLPGRSYSQDDLRRTGETDIGRALRRLDPAIY